MRIAGILKNMSKLLSSTKSEIQYKTLTKESLSAQLEDAIWMANILDGTIFSLSTKQLDEIWNKSAHEVKMNKDLIKAVGKGSITTYTKLVKDLKGKSRNYGTIVSLRYTNKIIKRLLTDTLRDIDSVIRDDGGVEINNVQISQGLFIGVLEASKIYTKFVLYLVAFIGNSIRFSNDKVIQPKYMIEYLNDNVDICIELVNHLCNASGKYSVINEITNIKSNGVDFKFNSTSDTGNMQSAKLITDVLGIENIFLTVFNIAVRPVALIGEVYIDSRHQYYTDIKDRKKWMEVHTAMLKMDLIDTDSDDPDYTKTMKAIQYYEDKITESDKKLDEYYNC